MAKFSRAAKLAIGILTTAPFLATIALLSLVIGVYFTGLQRGDPFMAHWIGVVGTLAVVAYLIGYTLVVIFCVDAWRNDRIPAERKGLWTVVLLIVPPFGLPAYWYTEVWKVSRHGPPSGTDASEKHP